MRTVCTKLYADYRGTSAIEFAIVAPIFFLLLFGLFYMCMCLSVIGSMHYAVEEGARCASVKTAVCTDNNTTIAYVKSHYYGPSAPPTFTYDPAAACGHSVNGSIDYVLDLGLKQPPVPISATACFP